jgi:uncharacterized protein YbjT (DUF2867 family)
MSKKTATLIGATGLIGGYLLQDLLNDPYFDIVRILIRRPLDLSHPKLEKKLVDFNDAESFRLALESSDAVFCAIGTTKKKVKGNKVAYRKIDFDIPVHAAKFCKESECNKFILVSSIGANSKSNNFYLKLKGEVEDAVKAIGIKSIHIMQPSTLLGARKEFRLGERIAQAIMKIFAFLIPSRYKAIEAKDVARAMLSAAKKEEEGLFIYDYTKIKRLNKQK